MHPEPSARVCLPSRPLNYRTLNYCSEYMSGCILQMSGCILQMSGYVLQMANTSSHHNDLNPRSKPEDMGGCVLLMANTSSHHNESDLNPRSKPDSMEVSLYLYTYQFNTVFKIVVLNIYKFCKPLGTG